MSIASHSSNRISTTSSRLTPSVAPGCSGAPGSSAAQARAANVSKHPCSPDEEVVHPKRVRFQEFGSLVVAVSRHDFLVCDLSLVSVPH